jgi:citronellol/citronellal dehydrogenase
MADSEMPTGRSLRGVTLFITGASRGIGRAIALRAARDGAHVAVVAKTAKRHRKLEGTIHQTVEEVEAAGGHALALQTDIQEEEQVASAIEQTVSRFGTLDILVNNASAISLANTETVAMRRFDLMHRVSTRGTFLCTKLALPHLKRSRNPHVLNLAPPACLIADWFAPHAAYTLAKFGMSLCTLAHAAEFREMGIAVNALWPLTTIATAAVSNVIDQITPTRSRSPQIMADAAWFILTAPSRTVTGRFFIDEEVLREHGLTDLQRYDVGASGARTVDLFVPEDVVRRSPTSLDHAPLLSTTASLRDPATMSRGRSP